MLGIRWLPEPVRVLEEDDIDTDYVVIGTPLENASIWMSFLNTTDQIIYISMDGTNDHYALPAGVITVDGIDTPFVSQLTIEVGTQRQAVGEQCAAAKNTQFYVRAAEGEPNVGAVFFMTSYLKGQ